MIRDAEAWSRKLDFVFRQLRGSARRQLGWHNTEVIDFPWRDRGAFLACTPDVYSSYKRFRVFKVPTPSVFPYYGDIIVNGTEAQKKVVTRIADAELAVYSFGAFFRVVPAGPVNRSSFNQLFDDCDGQGVLLRLLDAMVKERFNSNILRMIVYMDVNPTLAFIAIPFLCEVNWQALGSDNRFPYKYKTRNLSRVWG